MSSYKRKRAIGSASALVLGPYRAPRPPLKRRKAFIPGRDRTGGFYGRFSGRYHSGVGELKFHDVDLDDAVVATGGVVTDSINKIAQGVTESERIGRKCTIKTIRWKYRVDMPEVDEVGSPNTSEQIRVILFIDKQCNGATATAAGILEEAGEVHSFRNLANAGRFVVLHDKLHTLNWMTLASSSAGNVSSAEVIREFTFNKKCNLPIEFDSTTGAITEIRSNNIGVLLVSKVGTGGFMSKFRLRFSDM